MPPETIDVTRRRLFGGRPRATAIRPPWTGPAFEADCTRCRACLPACPESILSADARGYPQVSFAEQGCSFCGNCAKACPAPVFDLARPAWQLAVAIAVERCLPYQGVVCQSCRDACGAGAILFPLTAGQTARPVIDDDACTGCGFCAGVCPTKAVTIIPAMAAAPGEPAHG